MTLIGIFIALAFLYSLVSERLDRTVLTAPMVFTSAGALVVLAVPGLAGWKGSPELNLRIAEIGLVLLLFTAASRTDLRVLKSILTLPARLLSTGMLLTILLGGIAAKIIFPQLSIWEAGILSAILAATDAGLGHIIVNSPRVPMKIRQALNVEAGLNDGLSVPFLLFFIALAGAEAHRPILARFILEQVGLGTVIGITVGWVGGRLLKLAHRREWIAESWHQLGLVTLPLLCLLLSEAVAASMFIAAFVAGLAIQATFKEAGEHSVEFSEQWGQLLNLFVFFLFGLTVGRDWQQFQAIHVLYAVLSLTVVRIFPVAVALVGSRLSGATVLFMGWFGPRGLASIVLGLVYLEETQRSGGPTVRLAVVATVLLSIFAHGLTARPGMKLYARKIAALGPSAPENEAYRCPQIQFACEKAN